MNMTKPGHVSAQDYADIQNLYAYYNLCSDAGDADGYAACFSADGVLQIPTLDMTVTGRENLRAFKQKDKAQRGARYRRHWNSGLYLEPLNHSAIRGRCYLQAYNGEPGQLPELVDVGTYEDTLVKEAGEWCFAKRVITMDASSFTPPGR
jgi:hypothetical protein